MEEGCRLRKEKRRNEMVPEGAQRRYRMEVQKMWRIALGRRRA